MSLAFRDVSPSMPHADDSFERDRLIAGRNILFGLWAADRLGLTGETRETYATAVHLADLQAPGLDDVVGKVRRDLEIAGVEAGETLLRDTLTEMAQRAALSLPPA